MRKRVLKKMLHGLQTERASKVRTFIKRFIFIIRDTNNKSKGVNYFEN